MDTRVVSSIFVSFGTKSALAIAGFNLEKVHSFIGFKTTDEIPAMPSEEEREDMALGELAYLRRAIAVQAEFEQRAENAGGAFARYTEKVRAKDELQKELQQIEAEIAALQAENEIIEILDIEEAIKGLKGDAVRTDDEQTPSAAEDEQTATAKNRPRRYEKTMSDEVKIASVDLAYEEMKREAKQEKQT